MSLVDRRVPEQDSAQNEELSRRAKDKEIKRQQDKYDAEVAEVARQNAEIDKQNVLIEQQNAAEQARYDAEVLAFNKASTAAEDGRKAVNKQFDDLMAGYSKTHDEAVSQAYANEPEPNKKSGAFSQSYKDTVNSAGQQYNTLTTYTNEERQRSLSQYEFRLAYPTANFTQGISQAFKSAGPKDSLIGIYEKYQGSYDAQAVRSRQNALQNAGVIHSGVKQTRAQSKVAYVQPPQATSKSPIYSVEQAKRLSVEQRTANLQQIISPIAPRAQEKTPPSKHLTGVNTGQYIDRLNRPQTNVVSNPRALVAGLRKESIPDPIKEKPLVLIPAPITTTGKGTLEDPFVSKQPNYNKVSPFIRTQWTVSDVMTGKIKTDRSGNTILFDTKKNAEKFSGIVNRKYQSNIGYDNSGKPIQGPVQSLFTVENVNAKTKGKYPTLTFKSEEQANKYLNRTAKSEPFTGLVGNDFFAKNEFVATKPSIVESVTAPKTTSFNEYVEKSYNKLGELEEAQSKKSKSGDPFDLLREAQSNPPRQLARVGLGVAASLTNFGQQVANPILFKEAPYLFVSKPPIIPPKEITLKGDTADTTLIPVDFSEGITKPRLFSSEQYQTNQKKYIEKYGLISYVTGGSTLLIGVPSLLKSGGVKAMSLIKSPVRKSSNKFFEKQIPNMLDSGKVRVKKAPFSYNMPYSPTKRANEIKIDSYVEKIGPSTLLSKKPIAARQSDVIIKSGKEIKNIQPDSTYKPATRRNEINLDGGGEKIGPSTLLSKKPIAARQSDVRPFTPKEKIQPVKLDPFYKPKKLIDLSQDNKLVEFRGTQIKLGRTNVISPKPKKSLPKIVQEEKGYKPKGRFEGGFKDIFFSDKTVPKELSTFKSTKIQLGKAQSKGELFRGKQPKPVESEIGFKPAKKSKNIDLSQDNKLVEFKNDEVKMGGTGMEVKSGSQVTIQIQRSESITKKKLERKRQTPVNINWSEKPETILLPKTEKQPTGTTRSPLLVVIPRIKEKKKYLQEQKQYFDYDVLSDQRPQIKTIEKTIPRLSVSSVQQFKTSLSFAQPQKLSTDVKPKTATKQRLQTTQRLTQIPRYNQIFIPRQAQKTAQVPKLSAPLTPKQPQRLAQTPKLTPIPKIKLITRTRPPKKPPRMIIPFGLPKEEKKREVTKSLPGDKADFLGNTSETQVAGLFNRSETTYGLKKISRLRRGDKRELAGRSRSVPRKEAKFVEGGRKDPFGFKDNTKKSKKFRISF